MKKLFLSATVLLFLATMAAQAQSIKIGSIVTVNVKIWLLCATKADADQFGTFAGANDETGMENMENTGLGVEVHPGMKARLIDSDWLRYQIRLLDGDNHGYLGWLPREFVSAVK